MKTESITKASDATLTSIANRFLYESETGLQILYKKLPEEVDVTYPCEQTSVEAFLGNYFNGGKMKKMVKFVYRNEDNNEILNTLEVPAKRLVCRETLMKRMSEKLYDMVYY
jgi:hypothetical protein